MVSHRRRRLALGLAATALFALTASAPARADAVTDWNVHATDALVVTGLQTPPVWTLNLALVLEGRSGSHGSVSGAFEHAAGPAGGSRIALRGLAGSHPSRPGQERWRSYR